MMYRGGRKSFNLYIKPPCHTESKAALMLKRTTVECRLRLSCVSYHSAYRSSRTTLYIVLFPDLKLAWYSAKIFRH